MAQYFGKLNSRGKEITKCGAKSSGLQADCNAWNLGTTSILTYNETLQRDEVTVWLTNGSSPEHNTVLLGKYFINSEGQFIQTDYSELGKKVFTESEA